MAEKRQGEQKRNVVTIAGQEYEIHPITLGQLAKIKDDVKAIVSEMLDKNSTEDIYFRLTPLVLKTCATPKLKNTANMPAGELLEAADEVWDAAGFRPVVDVILSTVAQEKAAAQAPAEASGEAGAAQDEAGTEGASEPGG